MTESTDPLPASPGSAAPRTALCAIVARQRHESLLAEMDEAFERGARLLELRLDFLRSEPRIKEILAHRRCPVIATLRRREDGGKWAGSEERRVQLLRVAIAEGVDYVDLEEDVAGQIARFGVTKRIVSHHDMKQMPRPIGKLWGRLAKLDPDVIKIAGLAKKASDNFKMLTLCQEAQIPTIGICMGEVGLPSRILAAKVGAPHAYAAFNAERIVAPGLLTYDEMIGLYNFPSVNRQTEVFGVIGDPIAHSLSPLVHNAAFHALKMNRVYLPWRVSTGNLPRFLEKMHTIGMRGLSVTIPHKEAVTALDAKRDALVAKAGSANTVLIHPDGAIELANTDGPAALASLRAELPPNAPGAPVTINGKSVLILGAGGVVRTLAVSLHDAGAIVTLANRTSTKAQDLAREVGCKYVDWAQRESVAAEIVINGTSVGMHPQTDETPYHPGAMKEGMVFFDTVYNPMMTTMLRAAQERGGKVVTGVDMFVGQAEAQFRLFTGKSPPVGLMKELVLEELSPAKKMLREARLQRRDKS